MIPDRPRGLRGLTHVAPRIDDHRAAARVAVIVAVPALLLVATGHASWTIYAVFGAFTAMYGRREPHTARLLHQSRAAVMLVVGVCGGTSAAFYGVDSFALVTIEASLAGVGSVYSDRMGLRPSGPFWALFAFGACATVPVVNSGDVGAAATVSIGTAAFALAVGMAGRIRVRVRAPTGRASMITARIPYLVNASAYTVAVASAGGISTALGIGHPIWSMAAAAVPLAVSGIGERVSRGVHRILGTLVGLAVTAVILLPFGVPRGLTAVLLIIALQFATELYMTRNYGLALVFFTPLILLMLLLAHPTDSPMLIIDRAVETVIGTAVGIAVALSAHHLSKPSRPRRPSA
jgi:hypothetical protein